MKLMTGMVFEVVKFPGYYNEIVRIYTREDGKKMIEVEHFNQFYEDNSSHATFYTREFLTAIKKGTIRYVNNWASKN